MRLLYILTIFIHLCSAGFVNSAFADEAAKATAAEAFSTGKKAFNDGKYQYALSLFIKANRLNPSWKIEYNIGQSAAAAKQYGIALSAFVAYLNLGGDDIDAIRGNEVLKEIDRLKLQVGYLTVTAQKGATIFIDDFERGVAPISGPISVNGSIEQQAAAETTDGTRIKKSFSVPSGQTISIDLTGSEKTGHQEPAGPKNPSQNSTSETPSDFSPSQIPSDSSAPAPLSNDMLGLKIAGIVFVSVGGAVLIAGAVTGGMSLGIHKELKDACGVGKCTSDDSGKINRMNNFALTGTVLLPVGGVAAAAGLGMLIFRQVKTRKSESPKVTFYPSINGLIVEGRF